MRRLYPIFKIATLLSLVFASAVFPVAADEVSPPLTPSPSPVAYQLPYPGMLPDNPLYFIKVIRDAVWSFLISSPLKKADFDLLQADKRVNASYLLVTQEKGKAELAEMTFSKGENYFDAALLQTANAKKQGMDIGDIVKRLSVANLKHKETLTGIESSVGKEKKKLFKQDEDRLAELGKKLQTLHP